MKGGLQGWYSNLKNEVSSNTSFKSKFVILMFRISSLKHTKYNKYFLFIFSMFFVINYIIVDFLMGVEIKPSTKIGWGLIIFHPTSIIINPETVIGENFILRQGVTIGNKFNKELNIETKSPIIGNNVEIGANSTIVGDILMGDNVKVGANVFIDFNVPENSLVVPERSKIIKKSKVG